MSNEIQTLARGDAVISIQGTPFPVSTRIHLFEDYLDRLNADVLRPRGLPHRPPRAAVAGHRHPLERPAWQGDNSPVTGEAWFGHPVEVRGRGVAARDSGEDTRLSRP